MFVLLGPRSRGERGTAVAGAMLRPAGRPGASTSAIDIDQPTTGRL